MMNLGELRAWLRAHEDLPDDMKVGNNGRYGELEVELEGLEVRKDNQTGKAYVSLDGMPCLYPEPDQ